MPFDHWLAFVAASAILLAIPGPTVLLVISYALGHGRKAAAGVVTGVALGDLTAMTASMLGLGAILATSATIFTVLRWIGGAYLIYLGVALWRAPVRAADVDDLPRVSPVRMLGHAYAVTALNPKSIVFFVAFAATAAPGDQLIASDCASRPITASTGSRVTTAGLNWRP